MRKYEKLVAKLTPNTTCIRLNQNIDYTFAHRCSSREQGPPFNAEKIN